MILFGCLLAFGAAVAPRIFLVLAWIFLGQTVAPLQIAGAFVTVGAIAWLGVSKK